MRIGVTLVDPQWDLHEHVLIDADDATPLGDVARELVAVLATPGDPGAGVISLAGRLNGTPLQTTLFHEGRPLAADVALGDSGLKEGAVLTVGSAALSVVDEAGSPGGITDGDNIGVGLARSSVGPQQQSGRVLANVGDGELRVIQFPCG